MTHRDLEDLSAWLDGELGAEDVQGLEAHLQGCDECRTRLEAIRRPTVVLRATEAPAMTADETRQLRQQVTAKMGRRSREKTLAWAGGLATAAAAVLGLFLVWPFAGTERSQPTTEALSEAEEQSASFSSDEAVAEFVKTRVLPHEGWTVADVGEHQEERIELFTASQGRLTAGGPSQEDGGEQRLQTGDTSDSPASEVKITSSSRACVMEVLGSQPYPMMPLMVRAVSYKDRPGYLMAFAYSKSADEDDQPLDWVQVWVVDRARCEELLFLSFKP